MKLDPEHGLNPSVMVCFLCCNETGVALHGRLKDGEAAPRRTLDPEPCRECRGHMEAGIILISVDEEKSDPQDPYRTGGWVVVKEEAIRRILEPGPLLDHILERRFAFMPDDAWKEVGLPTEHLEEKPHVDEE